MRANFFCVFVTRVGFLKFFWQRYAFFLSYLYILRYAPVTYSVSFHYEIDFPKYFNILHNIEVQYICCTIIVQYAEMRPVLYFLDRHLSLIKYIDYKLTSENLYYLTYDSKHCEYNLINGLYGTKEIHSYILYEPYYQVF